MTTDAIEKAAAEMQANQRNFEAVLGQGSAGGTGWSHELVMSLSMGVLSLAAFAILLAAGLLWRQNAGSGEIVRVFGLIFIVALSAVLVIVGYSNEQLTPIIGLFGAAVGYLLGKDVPKQ